MREGVEGMCLRILFVKSDYANIASSEVACMGKSGEMNVQIECRVREVT